MKSLSSMSDTITHRGPDDVGLWSDVEAGIWLAHRRLSLSIFLPLDTSQCNQKVADIPLL